MCEFVCLHFYSQSWHCWDWAMADPFLGPYIRTQMEILVKCCTWFKIHFRQYLEINRRLTCSLLACQDPWCCVEASSHHQSSEKTNKNQLQIWNHRVKIKSLANLLRTHLLTLSKCFWFGFGWQNEYLPITRTNRVKTTDSSRQWWLILYK